MLYIRADGNSEIGTGHIMRCLSIANAVKKRGGDVTFIVADTRMESMLSEQGFDYICLDSVWNDIEIEIESMMSLIKSYGIEMLLIDSYYATPKYLQKLKDLTYLMYIDDLNLFHYSCDMLINYNIYAHTFNYPKDYPNTKLLLGCRYAPLREEFQNIKKREISTTAKSVLITAGGVDSLNAAGKIIEMAKETSELKDLKYHIIAGQLNPHIAHLTQLQHKYDCVTIHRNVRNMAHLMLECDIAVSAGGSTLYELCACGIPTVAFLLADNQRSAVEKFGNGYMLNAGDIRERPELVLTKILNGISELVFDLDLRYELSKKTQELIDGQGAMRIVNSLW